MKRIAYLLAALLIGLLVAVPTTTAAEPTEHKTMHRYLIERTFPAGALDAVDAEAKSRIIANNGTEQVRWLKSYVTEDKTRTFCIYEGPNQEAIRKVASMNGLPIDSITEIPGTLEP